ncbi:MAG: methyltransferase domain-containing protein [Nitrospirota bacterium]|jgi:2-polyprenyl-3-methyl-5-hydroxy-6-metoxy-1,4-benzoquinol methylase
MCTPVLDRPKNDAFADRMIDLLNDGALTLMISIGHRAGLFDAMAELPAATCEEIAVAAGLNERYVREWLGAMVSGDIVRYYPESATYHLPPEHAASLTRSATPNNVAVFAQYIPLLGQVEDRVVECFHRGGGVPYSAYPRFHEVMAEDSGQTVVAALLDDILPLVPGLVEALTAGIDVLDVGCGRARALLLLARTFPNSRFTGYDLSAEAIDAARAAARSLGLTNVRLAVRDVTNIGEAAAYDLITAFDAVHDQARPAAVLREIATALRPGGTFLMQDIQASSHLHNNVDHPIGPFLYTISCMHCMTVSLAVDGAGLGAVWGEEQAVDMVRNAGFRQVTVHRLPHDFQNNYYVATAA